jgi:hypothetical protein
MKTSQTFRIGIAALLLALAIIPAQADPPATTAPPVTLTGTGTIQNKNLDATNTIDGGALQSGSVAPGALLNLLTPGTVSIGNGGINFLAEGLIDAFVSPTNLALTSGTYPLLVSGSAVFSGTAWSLGQKTVTIGAVPSFSASGTNCATVINNYFGGYIHDVHLIVDQSFYAEVPLLTGDNTWLEVAPGVHITSATNSLCPVVRNAHETFVNTSGSAGTVTPLVSATSPLYGDVNIKISGLGTLDNNRVNQSSQFDPNYTYTVAASGSYPSFTNKKLIYAVEFSGVKNLDLEDFTIQNQTGFALCIGNCMNVTRRNLTVWQAIRGYPTDDEFHDYGSVVNEYTENCYAFNSTDNSFCWNPADYAASAGGFGTDDYWAGRCVDAGPDVNIYARNIWFDGGGFGFFSQSPAEDTAVGVANNIQHMTIDYAYLANDPANGATSTNTFGPAGNDIHFRHWYVDTLRGLQGFGWGSNLTNFSIEDFTCFNYTGAGAVFGCGVSLGGSNYSITGCHITGTGGSGQYLFVFNSIGHSSSVSGVYLANNVMTNAGGLFYDSAPNNNPVSNVGGDGNMLVNPASGADWIYLDPTQPTPVPTGLYGQFARSYGDEASDGYCQQVSLSTTNGLMANVGTSANRDAIKDVTKWLLKNGLYNNLCGWITRTQFNNGTANPIAIGGLAIPPSTTANSGIIVSSTGYWGGVWTASPVPLALTGTGPKTLVSVTSFGSATGFSDICKLGNGGGGGSLTGCMGLFKQNGTGTQIEAIAPYGGGTQVYSSDLQLAPSGPFVSGSAVFYGDVFNGTTQSLSYISGTTTGSTSASSAPPNVASGSVFNWQTDVSGAGTATYSITLYWPVALTTSQLQALRNEIAVTVGAGLGM